MNKSFLKIIPAITFALTIGILPAAQAEVDPFPSLALGAEIPGTRVQGQIEITCPEGSSRGILVDVSAHQEYTVCNKSWRPSAEIQADIDFQEAQRSATAAAEAESKAWAEAHPGQQKCIQWGPIVHANGVSTSSGGVCANPVPVPQGAQVDSSTSVSNSETSTITSTSAETSTPTVETVTAPILISAPAPVVQAPITSGLGGYAVIHPDGHVCGVMVATSTDPYGNGGVMPIEYMGCPIGARIVFQTTPSETGNVAGWHGENVRYDGTNFVITNNSSSVTINNGTATDNNGRTWDTGTGNVINAGTAPLPNLIDSTTAVNDSTTALIDSQTAIAVPLAISAIAIGADLGSALIPAPTAADDLDSLPEVEAEEEISNTIEAKMVGNKTRVAIATEWISTKLSVTASKKGSKKKYTYRFTTDSEGNYTFKSSVNLKGFTLVLLKGSTELDRDTV